MSEIVLGFDDSQVLLWAEEVVDAGLEPDQDFTLTRFDYDNGNTYLLDNEANIAKEYLWFSSRYHLYDYGKLAVERYALILEAEDTTQIDQDMTDALTVYKRSLQVAAKISDLLLLQAFNKLSQH